MPNLPELSRALKNVCLAARKNARRSKIGVFEFLSNTKAFGRIFWSAAMNDMDDMDDRNILHMDMDAFFAAIEQFDRPELRGKPVLIGGDPQSRSVVSTASYEARPYGCRSAMPMAQAVRLCPQAIIVRPRMGRYVEVSRRIFEIVERFTPLVETLSIDEAFVDVTGSTRLFGPPEVIAKRLKQSVYEETGLTASVGVAPNKFLAKLASDMEKPDGLVVVRTGGVLSFLDPIPISRLWGVGVATLPRMEEIGVRTFGDLRRFSEDELRDRFGEAGEQFYYLVRGIDDRPVVPDREAKSISQEVTFPSDVKDRVRLRAVILLQTDHVAYRMRRHGLSGKTVTLKIRSADFKTITRSRTLSERTNRTDVLWEAAAGLFEEWSRRHHWAVRLIGMGVSQLSSEQGGQLLLFDQEDADRYHRLDETIDEIRDRFGEDAVSRGRPEDLEG